MDKQELKFWIFSIDDTELNKFYEEHKEDSSLYYNIAIKSVPTDIPEYVLEELHLKEDKLLFVKDYLIPIYQKLDINGYVIILSSDLYNLSEHKAVLNFGRVFENIIDLDSIGEAQRKCFFMCYDEYCLPYDEFQIQMIRNLVLNAMMLSVMMNSKIELKTGHLLNIVFQFTLLVNQYAITERKKQFYTERLAVTNNLFDVALKTVLKKTFREILNGRIISESIYSIVFTRKNISQIAHDLNYDVSDFNRMFIKYGGCSPKEYRKRMLKIIDYANNNR